MSSSVTQFNVPNIEEWMRERRRSIRNRELLIAAGEGNVENVKCLIKYVDVNFVDGYGNTALHYAVIKGSDKVVNFLLENGADIYIENDNNKTPFDIAVSHKMENIIRILGRKIVDKSLEIIKMSEVKKTYFQNREPKPSSKKETDLKKAIKKTEKKIKALLKCLGALTVNNNELSHEQAKIFIYFLETFSFQSTSDKNIKKGLIEHFMKGEENDIISETRNLILKSRARDIKLSDVRFIIESCYEDQGIETQSKVKSFFDQLKKYVECKTQISVHNTQDNIRKVSYFFKLFPKTIAREEIGKKSDTTDILYNKLEDLVLAAYKKGENFGQHWFEFIVNIYPALGIENKKTEDLSKVEIRLRHLRNILIHDFFKFDIQKFGAAIINLRSQLFEYRYANEVHKRFESLNCCVEIEKFKINLNEDIVELQDKFKDSEEILSEEDAQNLLGYKFEKSLFPKQSPNNDNSTIKCLVEDYFKYMSIIKDVDRADLDAIRGRNVHVMKVKKKYLKHKKLDDVTRREIFEKFRRLRRIKENCTDGVYRENQKKLLSDLGPYGVDKTTFSLVCKYYLEEGNNFNKEVSKVIANVVRVIESINQIKKSYNYKEKEIISLGDHILNKDTVDKEPVLCDNKMELEKSGKIMQLFDQVDFGSKVHIPINNIILKIDIQKTVMNILRMFYNTYNKYKIDFNVEDIFSRESFLNELVWHDVKKIKSITVFSKKEQDKQILENNKYLFSNTFVIINTLIDIEYMSPYIVKLIENRIAEGGQACQVINKFNIVKLIDILSNEKEYVTYLNILLSFEMQSLNLYEKLYDKIIEKKVDIKNIRSIFNEFKHLTGFAGLLKPTIPNNEQKSNNTLELTKSFLRIINEEAADRLYCTDNYDEALKILKKGKDIQERFEKCSKKKVMEYFYPDFIDRDLLIVRIRNRQKDYEGASNILTEAKKKFGSCSSVNLKTKFLLISCDTAYTNTLLNKCSEYSYDDLYSEVIKYILSLDDISERFDVAKTVKEKYNEIKSLGRYKSVLSSSPLLCSEKYLDILTIAADSTYPIIEAKKNEGKCKNDLKIHEEIYSCMKKDNKNISQFIWDIAHANSTLGNICKVNEKYSDALSYYLVALSRFNIVYNAQRNMYGPGYAAVSAIRRNISYVINNISHTQNELGDTKFSSNIEEALQHYNEALDNYKEVYEIHKSYRSRKQKNTLMNIAHINNNLGRAFAQNKNMLSRALHHYQTAIEIFGELKKKTRRKNNKAEQNYEKTKVWKDQLELSM